jgi:hypothetical protein
MADPASGDLSAMHLDASPRTVRARLLDWVVDRVARRDAPGFPTEDRRSSRAASAAAPYAPRTSTPPVRRAPLAFQDAATRILALGGPGWSSARVLEISHGPPALVFADELAATSRFAAIVASDVDLRRTAARRPRLSFLSGPVESSLAVLAGEFDRIVLRPDAGRRDVEWLGLSAQRMSRRGALILCLPEISCDARAEWRAAVERARLKVRAADPRPDGTLILLGRRRS